MTYRSPYRPAAPGTSCTVGPTAVDGTRCGAPAVVEFTGSDGTPFFECATHAPAHALTDAKHGGVRLAAGDRARMFYRDGVRTVEVTKVMRTRAVVRVPLAHGSKLLTVPISNLEEE